MIFLSFSFYNFEDTISNFIKTMLKKEFFRGTVYFELRWDLLQNFSIMILIAFTLFWTGGW